MRLETTHPPSSTNHRFVYLSVSFLTTLRPALVNVFDVSDEERAPRAIVAGAYVSNGRADDVVTFHICKPVVYWVFVCGIVDPYVWDP